VVLLNPWVRTDEGLARATLKHYYRARLLEPAFWGKVVRGQFDLARAARSFGQLAASALGRKQVTPQRQEASRPPPLPERMYAGLARFRGQVLVIVSGNDLTAREFTDLAAASPRWRQLLAAPRVRRHELAGADHTFSRRVWRDQVALWTADWIASW
jgi:hypothetical protein